MASVCVLAALAPASAYYHFLRYTSRNAPFTTAPEKFDLNSLPNKTLSFYATDQGPGQFNATDSFGSVLGQMRQAAEAWNAVETSDLRVVFGGVYPSGAGPLAGSTPAGEVVFEELPPGILGYGGPTSRSDLALGPNGLFVPVTRATLHLSRDLTRQPGPSYSEAFFLTAVHEMGHALGLQHTMTSSAMSTDVSRATSRSKPLDSDDAAAISLLYPARNYANSVGSIAGRVTVGGQGAHLASIVAMRPGGSSISALSNPDGTYRIDGVPPGQYLVYVSPLPPAPQAGRGPADIVLPLDVDGRPVAASGAFETVFYPGTRDPNQASPVTVRLGVPAEGINFTPQARAAVGIQRVTTYSFFDQATVKPAYVNVTSPAGLVVVAGAGLMANGAPVSGLAASVVGGSAVVTAARAYAPAPSFLALDLQFNLFSGQGPRHLVFSLPNDIYVQPNGLNLVERRPPAVTAVAPGFDQAGNRVVTLTGANFTAESIYCFDSLPAAVRAFDDAAGRVVVSPPPGVPGQRAVITVYNPDGQSSAFVQGQTPASYTYDSASSSVLFAAGPMTAGGEALIEVSGVNTNFSDNTPLIGFANSDVTVQRVLVASPTRLLVNVLIAPGGNPGSVTPHVISGFQLMAPGISFPVQPFRTGALTVSSQVVTPSTGRSALSPGATAVLTGSNLAVAGATLTLNDQRAAILSATPGQVTFQVPAGLAPGVAILRYGSGPELASIAVPVESAPSTIVAVLTPGNQSINTLRPARPGEVLNVHVTGMADPASNPAAGRVVVNVGGFDHPAFSVGPSSLAAGHQVQFTLSPSVVNGAQVPLTVSIDGRASAVYPIAIRAQ